MLRPTAVKAVPQKGYLLDVTFDNGEMKIFDVKPYIKGEWYGELSNENYFNTVTTDGFTVVWPNGQDVCPDDLYYLSKEKEGLKAMGDREQAIELLKAVPDNEISYIIGYIQGLTAKNKNFIEEVEPDEWDLKMIAEAEKENDGETVSLEEMLKKDGLTYADLQD